MTEVDIPNPDGALTSGAYCTVELHIPRKTPSIMLRPTRLLTGGGLQAAVIEDGVARIRKISVARDFGKEVEVRDGLKPGDQVILNPSVSLRDGSKVKAVSSCAEVTCDVLATADRPRLSLQSLTH